MRTIVAFSLVAAALMAIGAVTAVASLPTPKRDLFLPPLENAMCADAYSVRAMGTLGWTTLEGGFWVFEADRTRYDLVDVERFLPANRMAWLKDHADTERLPVAVEGVAEPCLVTFHMYGHVLRATALVESTPDLR